MGVAVSSADKCFDQVRVSHLWTSHARFYRSLAGRSPRFRILWRLRALFDSDATPREAIDRLAEAAVDQIRWTRTEHTPVHTVWPSGVQRHLAIMTGQKLAVDS